MLLERIIKSDGIPPGRIEEVRRYLAQITAETTRVGRIVSDLLCFARQSRTTRSEADLNALVTSTLQLLDHKCAVAACNRRAAFSLSARRIPSTA